MNALPDGVRSAAGGARLLESALLEAVAEMDPGWTVLRDCALADDDQGARARVRYALLHPDTGIALLDLLPGATTPGAPDRLRKLLDSVGFRSAFGGYPPIVYLCMPSRSLSGLGVLLVREFDLLSPLALVGGDAWVGAVQGVLTTEPPLHVPEHAEPVATAPFAARPDGSRVGKGRFTQRPDSGFRGLAAFWGVVALAFGGGALVLHGLGPPEGPSVVAHAGAAGRAEPPGTWPPAETDTPRPPSPRPILALWPAERMPLRFDVGGAGAAVTPESDGSASAEPGPSGEPLPARGAESPESDSSPEASSTAPTTAAAEASSAHQAGEASVAGAGVEARPSVAGGPSDPVPADGNPLSGSSERPRDQPPPAASLLDGTRAAALPEPAGPAPAGGGPIEGVVAPLRSEEAAVADAAGEQDARTAVAPADTASPVAAAPASPDVPNAPSGADEGLAAQRGVPSEGAAAPTGPETPAPTSLGAAPADRSTGSLGAEAPSTVDAQEVARTDPRSALPPEGVAGASAAEETAAQTPRDAPAPDLALPSPTGQGAAAPAAAPQPPTDARPLPEAPGMPAPQAAAIAAPPAAEAPEPARQPAAAAAAAAPVARPPVPEPRGPAAPAGEAERRAPASVSMPPALVEAFVSRGDAMVARRDISAARLLYERAAVAGDARAASALARTYDPAFLAEIGARGVRGDPAIAMTWYQKAAALGDSGAQAKMEALNGAGPAAAGRP